VLCWSIITICLSPRGPPRAFWAISSLDSLVFKLLPASLLTAWSVMSTAVVAVVLLCSWHPGVHLWPWKHGQCAHLLASSIHIRINLFLLVDIHTPYIRSLLVKLICYRLVKKFRTFYGIRRFIAVFTRFRYLSLSWSHMRIHVLVS
jgi:hypothetical protein